MTKKNDTGKEKNRNSTQTPKIKPVKPAPTEFVIKLEDRLNKRKKINTNT